MYMHIRGVRVGSPGLESIHPRMQIAEQDTRIIRDHSDPRRFILHPRTDVSRG